LLGIFLLLSGISGAAAYWCASRGYTLYYGDAEAHLNISRRLLDSRTPGPEQIGTVWLPLPHVLTALFVHNDSWWRSGVAGVIPSAACFVAAGVFLFAAARRAYRSAAAGFAAALLFALNPNILYLQSVPMTETIFAACFAALLWATIWYRDSPHLWAVIAAAAASNAASLTRYEGWFLIPFVALYFLITGPRKTHALVFAVLAALAPLAWLAHNQYYYSNVLEFYNGEYSAKAIYGRALAQGLARYPGDGDWRQAVHYYFVAMKLADGAAVLLAGAAGLAVALWKKVWWPLLLLALPPVFYIWSIHSSGTPIFVPVLPPYSWYNTRYALAALPLAAFAAAGLAAAVPPGARAILVAALVGAGTLPWIAAGEPICWRESQVNSAARRAWTRQAAEFLQARYRSGSGVIYTFGDLTGVLRQAGIPLREGLQQGNHPAWDAAIAGPQFFLREEWALAESGDQVATAILRAQRHGPHYELRKQIIVKGAPVIEIYQRALTQPQ
jgi:4-amino-4-deoxy-L-arabinose transferase-like glycosyltransferase